MADIPANHQKPEEFAPSRADEAQEVAAVWTAEQWAEENRKALKAEANAARAGAPVAPAGQEG